MLKLVFILIINSYQGGINTDLHFDTLAKCEAAKNRFIKKPTGRREVVTSGRLALKCK